MSSSFDAAPVVILSSIDWDAAWQRHQIFATLWARSGRDVYFVENLGFREPGFEDWRRVAGRLKRLASPGAKTRAPRHERLRLIAPGVLPPTRELFRKLNGALFVPRLAEKLPKDAIVVCYLPTATTLQLLDELRPRAVIYDCVDNFYGHPKPPRDLAETDRELLRRSDAVTTTSPTLKERLDRAHDRVIELHQGVPDGFFVDARGAKPAKKLAYFGTVWTALDFEALGALAAAGYEVDLIGPVKEDAPTLPPGVRRLDSIAHDHLPKALSGYDALLLPYRETPYNKGVVPAKLYECLATGLPVLSSPLPALEGRTDVLVFARTPGEWVAAAKKLPGDEAARKRRLEAARARRQSDVFAALVDEARRAWNAEKRRPDPPPLTRTRAFFAALAPLGLLTLAARAIGLVTLVWAGRWLGPAELGRVAGAAAIGAAVAVLPQMGLPGALARGIAYEPDERKQGAAIATALTVFLTAAAIWLTVLAGFRERLADALDVSEALVDLGLALGYSFAFAVVAESPLVGLAKYARRGAAELAAGISLPILLFLLSSRASHESVVLAWAGALLVGAALSTASLLPRLRFGFEPKSLDVARRHWGPSFTSNAAAALVFAPQPLLLARAASWADAGIFAAYACATTSLASALTEPVGLVLGRIADAPLRGAPWRALGWRGAGRALVAAPFLLLFARLVFAALGAQYPFEWGIAARFALAGALAAALFGLAARADAGGINGARIAAGGRMAAGLVNLQLAPHFVAANGLTGAADALALACGAGILWFAALDVVSRLRS